MPTRKQESRLPVKWLTVAAVAAVVIAAAAAACWNFLADADYFKVKDVKVTGEDPAKLQYLKNRNILFLDIGRESRRLLASCPECSTISIVKVPPGRLWVQFVRRNPAALVKAGAGYVGLDEDGTLYALRRGGGEPAVPVILGLERHIDPARLHAGRPARELMLALAILQEVGGSKALRSYEARTLAIADPMAISLTMMPRQGVAAPGPQAIKTVPARNLEIKFVSDKIREKFVILNNLLAQGNVDIANIQYLDMRYKDPVMKLYSDK